MSAMKKLSLTQAQMEQFRELIESAISKGRDLTLHLVPPDAEGMENLLKRKEQFSVAFVRRIIIAARTIAAKSQLEDEEVPSSFGYLVGYKQVHMGMEQLKGFQPKPIAKQVQRLNELIPGLGSADQAIAEKELPEGAEAYFAIPRWEKIAPTYGQAVEMILDLIKKHSPDRLFNYRKDKLNQEYLREYEPSLMAWKQLTDAQSGNDIYVVPAQFGLRHRGRSFRRARERMVDGEFGLGLFAVLCMLLLHPERFRDYDDLWMECPGDEYAPDGDGRYAAVPFIFHYRGEIEIDILDCNRAKIGSVSGFLPQ